MASEPERMAEVRARLRLDGVGVVGGTVAAQPSGFCVAPALQINSRLRAS